MIYSLFFGIIGILSKVIYRPMVIDHNINDFGISGFAPNLFAAVAICLLAAFFTKTKTIKIMIFCTIGILLYEAEQIWTSRTFNFLDILATKLGLVLAIFIYRKLNRSLSLETPKVRTVHSNH